MICKSAVLITGSPCKCCLPSMGLANCGGHKRCGITQNDAGNCLSESLDSVRGCVQSFFKGHALGYHIFLVKPEWAHYRPETTFYKDLGADPPFWKLVCDTPALKTRSKALLSEAITNEPAQS